MILIIEKSPKIRAIDSNVEMSNPGFNEGNMILNKISNFVAPKISSASTNLLRSSVRTQDLKAPSPFALPAPFGPTTDRKSVV